MYYRVNNASLIILLIL